MAWPQDAARRNAADFVSASVFSGERITIRAGRAALNPPLIIAGILGRIPPRPVVNHWAFDAEELPVEIGNDEEERWGLFGHGLTERALSAHGSRITNGRRQKLGTAA